MCTFYIHCCVSKKYLLMVRLFHLETPHETKDPAPEHSHTVNGLQMQASTCLFENLWLETNIVITWEAAHIASCLTNKMCSPQWINSQPNRNCLMEKIQRYCRENCQNLVSFPCNRTTACVLAVYRELRVFCV